MGKIRSAPSRAQKNPSFHISHFWPKYCPDLLSLFQKFIILCILIQKLHITYQNKGISVYFNSGKYHHHWMKFGQWNSLHRNAASQKRNLADLLFWQFKLSISVLFNRFFKNYGRSLFPHNFSCRIQWKAQKCQNNFLSSSFSLGKNLTSKVSKTSFVFLTSIKLNTS